MRLAIYNEPKRVGATTPHLRMERDPVSKTLCSLEYQRMDKVQKPGNPKCYTPSSEHFRI
jgi:hypothetical protein